MKHHNHGMQSSYSSPPSPSSSTTFFPNLGNSIPRTKIFTIKYTAIDEMKTMRRLRLYASMTGWC